MFVLEHPIHAGEIGGTGGGGVVARRIGTRLALVSRPVMQEAFPAGEMMAFAACSPYARCMRGGEPVIFARPDSQTLERTRPGGREILSRYAGFLAVPATAGAEVAGFLTFARTAGWAAFDDADTATAARLAAGTGTGIANAMTLMRHRFIAGTLQRSLLAAEPAAPPGLEATARCLPAAGQIARLGGLRAGPHQVPARRSVLPCGPGQLDTVCDRLISALAERFEDDVTVVLVRIPTTGTGPPKSAGISSGSRWRTADGHGVTGRKRHRTGS